jgi:hypothetical protein
VIPNQLLAFLLAVSFAAGLNVSLTVATLGLLSRAGVLTLPGELEVLGSWWVIGTAGVIFVIEFFADKIPAFDLVWNTLQTFIRVPAGAVLAYAGTAQLDPMWQFAAAAAGGTVALGAHSAKVAMHSAVTPSPEPFSNFFISLAGEAFVIFIIWFASEHPYIAATVVIILLAVIVLLVRWMIRAIVRLFRRFNAPRPTPVHGGPRLEVRPPA